MRCIHKLVEKMARHLAWGHLPRSTYVLMWFRHFVPDMIVQCLGGVWAPHAVNSGCIFDDIFFGTWESTNFRSLDFIFVNAPLILYCESIHCTTFAWPCIIFIFMLIICLESSETPQRLYCWCASKLLPLDPLTCMHAVLSSHVYLVIMYLQPQRVVKEFESSGREDFLHKVCCMYYNLHTGLGLGFTL